jgi:hypothetical protein
MAKISLRFKEKIITILKIPFLFPIFVGINKKFVTNNRKTIDFVYNIKNKNIADEGLQHE